MKSKVYQNFNGWNWLGSYCPNYVYISLSLHLKKLIIVVTRLVFLIHSIGLYQGWWLVLLLPCIHAKHTCFHVKFLHTIGTFSILLITLNSHLFQKKILFIYFHNLKIVISFHCTCNVHDFFLLISTYYYKSSNFILLSR